MKKTISRNDLQISPSVDFNKLDIHINKEDAPPKTDTSLLKSKKENGKAAIKQNVPNEYVGSDNGGVYPYNINSNTSDKTHE